MAFGIVYIDQDCNVITDWAGARLIHYYQIVGGIEQLKLRVSLGMLEAQEDVDFEND